MDNLNQDVMSLPPMTQIPPPMPAEIAAAIAKVKGEVIRLHKGERNAHGGFNYATVDQFYEAIGPLEADAGLVVLPQHVGPPRMKKVATKGGETTVVVYSFIFMIAHSSGASWCNVNDVCEQSVAWMGAQTAGAAKSYAHKYYLRSLYSVPTGEKDADAQERWELDEGQARAKAIAKRKETGAPPPTGSGITFMFDEMEVLQLAEILPRVRRTLNAAPPHIRLAWAADNERSLSQLHGASKATWLEVRKIIDGASA